MLSKFEAWIPKLGREVDATKLAWRFVPGLMRTKFEASSWIPKHGKPISVRRKRKGWRMPPWRRRKEGSSRRGEVEDEATT